MSVDSDAQSLLDLLGHRSSAIELDRAAIEIARIEYPDLDAAGCIAELDRHAWAIAERAGDLSDGPRFVEAANAYLLVKPGSAAMRTITYHPDNSCLNRVLETKRGIPITLSVIYIEIARRLAANQSHGVGLPFHFLVRYDESGYTAIIDPFHGGAILDEAQCCQLLQVEAIDRTLFEPVDRRHIADAHDQQPSRHLLRTTRIPMKALPVLDLLIAADPSSPDEHRQRAAALLRRTCRISRRPRGAAISAISGTGAERARSRKSRGANAQHRVLDRLTELMPDIHARRLHHRRHRLHGAEIDTAAAGSGVIGSPPWRASFLRSKLPAGCEVVIADVFGCEAPGSARFVLLYTIVQMVGVAHPSPAKARPVYRNRSAFRDGGDRRRAPYGRRALRLCQLWLNRRPP